MIKKTAHQPKLVPESIFFFIHTNDMVTHLIMEMAWFHLEASLAENIIHWRAFKLLSAPLSPLVLAFDKNDKMCSLI